MTIKELENRTGMTRANIRFYEGEGLLSPKRLENGYRDYSEEDARTLEKIRLLRQLQLDIDTIRKIQQGTLTLEQALFTQLTRLEGDKALIKRAAEVCRELERSGVEYTALEPQPYLQQLQAPAQPQLSASPSRPVVPERDDTPRACWHPWQRYFARSLDITIYSTVFRVLWLVFTRDLIAATGLLGWFLGLLGLAFALAVEPLWLHFWGWTPGKWVFGLKLRDKDGNKLTISQGLCRGYNVFIDGYGLNIPFWDLWKMWQCRKLGLEGRDCYWDGENDYRYTKEERRVHPAVTFAAVTALSVALLFMGIKYTETPPNRGELTVAEFAQNYGHYHHMLLEDSGLPTLDGRGRWAEQEEQPGVATIHLFGDTTVWDDPEFTMGDGRVTAVTLHMESEDDVVSSGWREYLAMMALSGSVDGLNLFNYDVTGWARLADETLSRWGDVELDYRGLHISQRVEYSGYTVLDTYLWGEDDVPQHCEKTVTISLIE